MKTIPPDCYRRILIIDDNPAIHSDFHKLLTVTPETDDQLTQAEVGLFGTGPEKRQLVHYELSSAYQGQEGLAAVQQAIQEGHPFAMAFVDVRMPPGWDGI